MPGEQAKPVAGCGFKVEGDGAEAPPVADEARRRNRPKRRIAPGKGQGDY